MGLLTTVTLLCNQTITPTYNMTECTFDNTKSHIHEALLPLQNASTYMYVHDASFPNISTEVLSPIENPQRAERISFVRCQVETITRDAFNNFTNLRTINLTHNAIADLPFLPVTLTKLHMDWNRLTSISESFCDIMRSLETLTLSHNFIREITCLPKLLAWLDVSDNQLKYMDADTIPLLNTLNVARNKLSNMFFVKLTQLYYYHHITELNLANNHLDGNYSDLLNSLSTSFAKLITLDLSYNKITDVTFNSSTTPNLKNVYLQHNSLTNAHFLPQLVNVVVANISHNDIPKLTEDDVNENIDILDVSRNRITLIDIKSRKFSRLTTLDISGNALHDQLSRSSSPCAFCTFPKLARLDISFNDLTNISATHFYNSTDVKFVSSAGNPLQHLDVFYTAPFANATIDLYDVAANISLSSVPPNVRNTIHVHLQRGFYLVCDCSLHIWWHICDPRDSLEVERQQCTSECLKHLSTTTTTNTTTVVVTLPPTTTTNTTTVVPPTTLYLKISSSNVAIFIAWIILLCGGCVLWIWKIKPSRGVFDIPHSNSVHYQPAALSTLPVSTTARVNDDTVSVYDRAYVAQPSSASSSSSVSDSLSLYIPMTCKPYVRDIPNNEESCYDISFSVASSSAP